MDIATLMPFIVQAIGGLIGGNLGGAATRGGGGVPGRSIIGIIGGLAAGYGLQLGSPDTQAMLSSLISGEAGQHLGNLITGAAGGGILGLVSGLLVRPRAAS
jgi:hypothetical protein